jgi:hypothetical protein
MRDILARLVELDKSKNIDREALAALAKEAKKKINTTKAKK